MAFSHRFFHIFDQLHRLVSLFPISVLLSSFVAFLSLSNVPPLIYRWSTLSHISFPYCSTLLSSSYLSSSFVMLVLCAVGCICLRQMRLATGRSFGVDCLGSLSFGRGLSLWRSDTMLFECHLSLLFLDFHVSLLDSTKFWTLSNGDRAIPWTALSSPILRSLDVGRHYHSPSDYIPWRPRAAGFRIVLRVCTV